MFWNGVVEFLEIKIKTNFSFREKKYFLVVFFPDITNTTGLLLFLLAHDELPFSVIADQAEGVSGGQPVGREGAVRVRGRTPLAAIPASRTCTQW